MVRNTGSDVVLTCNTCGVELRSSWVFDGTLKSSRGKLRTLVPSNGHTACGGRYISVTGVLIVRDFLGVCPHGSQRSRCVKCGGSEICIHKKRRNRCPLCKASLDSSLVEDSCRTDGSVTIGGENALSGKDRGSAKGGVYSPSVKVRSNPLVRNTGQDVILTCKKCRLELRSSWVFDYLGKARILVPRHGHSACGGKYVPTDAKFSVKQDNPTHLDICPHGSQRSLCVKCGGSGICVHRKRISACPHCLAAGYQKRKRKEKTHEGKATH
ncbi:unnamed protein product [Polarella glacialis]|nr:unnamed protein product [Polarella glacialis]